MNILKLGLNQFHFINGLNCFPQGLSLADLRIRDHNSIVVFDLQVLLNVVGSQINFGITVQSPTDLPNQVVDLFLDKDYYFEISTGGNVHYIDLVRICN